MIVRITFLAISAFTLASSIDRDEDMLLYWRRSASPKCEPFTTYEIKCNKCVCSADGTEFCTRMACFKAPRFSDESSKTALINDYNRPDPSDYRATSA